MRWLIKYTICVWFIGVTLIQGANAATDRGEEEVLEQVIESYSGNQMHYVDASIILNDSTGETTEKDWMIEVYRDDAFVDVYIAYSGSAIDNHDQMLDYHVNNDYVSVVPDERYNSIFKLDASGNWIPNSEATYSGSNMLGYTSIISSLTNREQYMFITYYRMSIDDLSAFNDSKLKIMVNRQALVQNSNPISVIKFIIIAILITVIFYFQAYRRNRIESKTS